MFYLKKNKIPRHFVKMATISVTIISMLKVALEKLGYSRNLERPMKYETIWSMCEYLHT